VKETDEPFPFVKPHECGTFTLTEEQKQAILKDALDQRDARRASMPTDQDAVRVICDGYHRLQELGWREAMYAPRDSDVTLELIEAGSSGIHVGYRDTEGHFWIQDDDTWPSSPILWRLKS
jgi:hypothetical protein